ncbi:MAG: hypothetical protein IT292_10065 [Deltaproteobacteria bacterium]|nr:hypothetical protein [Deltaproteobacteria bacterium]
MHLRSSLICIFAMLIVFLYGYKGNAIYSFASKTLGNVPTQVMTYANSALSAVGLSKTEPESTTTEIKQPPSTKPFAQQKPNVAENRFSNLHGTPPKNAADKQGLYFDRLREQLRERQATASEDEMMDNEPEEDTPQDNDETVEPVADPYAQFKRPAEANNQNPQPFIDAEDTEPEELQEDTEPDMEPETGDDEVQEEPIDNIENEDL